MEGFIIIISIVWGFLSIILFFKIWKMTENVEKLTQLVEKIAGSKGYNGLQCESSTDECSSTKNDNSTEPAPEEEPICHNFKVGDKVFHVGSVCKSLTVEKIEGNQILCYAGYFTGYKVYHASELKPYKE